MAAVRLSVMNVGYVIPRGDRPASGADPHRKVGHDE
jgi:hypothetical protein